MPSHNIQKAAGESHRPFPASSYTTPERLNKRQRWCPRVEDAYYERRSVSTPPSSPSSVDSATSAEEPRTQFPASSYTTPERLNKRQRSCPRAEEEYHKSSIGSASVEQPLPLGFPTLPNLGVFSTSLPADREVSTLQSLSTSVSDTSASSSTPSR